MLSLAHESLVLLFRNRPELAPELVRDVLGLELPAYSEARVDSADLSDVVPAEYRAVLVVLLVDGKPVFAIVVEVQLSPDDRKRFTWPVYAAGLRARLECDCIVLVVTPSAPVARWAAQPIRLGARSVFEPVVIGPAGVPVVTDPDAPPELALLSVVAHGHGDLHQAVEIAIAAEHAARKLQDADRRAVYYDLIVAALSEAAQEAFVMLPQGYEWQSDLARNSAARGRAEGEARGRAEGVLEVLEARGIAVSDVERQRVLGCTDLDRLRCWMRRAATIAKADELFVD
jgi:hypothetical protein